MPDITALILAKSDVGNQAAKLADSVCVGNERSSWLDRATVTIRPTDLIVEFDIKLRNQAGIYVKNPITGKNVRVGTAFSDTSTAKLTGFMGSSCAIQAYTVTSANAIYQVLGVFATFLVNSGPLKLVLTNDVCKMLHRQALTSTDFVRFSAHELASSAQDDLTYNLDCCLKAFQDISNDVIDCTVPIALTDQGKKDILQQTYGIIVDAKSNFNLHVRRGEIPGWFQEDAIRVPQQHVECLLSTNDQPLNIDFTVAPVVNIVNHKAVNATVNMDNVTGIPSYLGEILKSKVNSNQQLCNSIVDFVNQRLDVFIPGGTPKER